MKWVFCFTLRPIFLLWKWPRHVLNTRKYFRFGPVAAEQIFFFLVRAQNRFPGGVALSLVSVLYEISHLSALYVDGMIIRWEFCRWLVLYASALPFTCSLHGLQFVPLLQWRPGRAGVFEWVVTFSRCVYLSNTLLWKGIRSCWTLLTHPFAFLGSNRVTS